MSSPARYTFTNRRSEPSSSEMRTRSSSWRSNSPSSTSCTVAPSICASASPPAAARSCVGIFTTTLIRPRRRRPRIEGRRPSRMPRRVGSIVLRLERAAHGVQRLQALAGDHQHDALVRVDVAARGQLRQHRGRDASRRLREDPGRLRQQRDARADLLVADGVHRAARAPRQLERVRAVGGVPDRQRLGDRVRLHRPADLVAVGERARHRRAALGLGAVHARQRAGGVLDEPELGPFLEAARRFS